MPTKSLQAKDQAIKDDLKRLSSNTAKPIRTYKHRCFTQVMVQMYFQTRTM